MRKRIIGKAMALSMFVALTAVFALAGNGLNPDGRPPKHGLGYRIWRDGNTWTMRMGAKDRKRHFSGVIKCKGGRISEAWAFETEKRRDYGEWNSREIKFDFKAKKGKDGLGWNCNCQWLEFDLRIDGARKPNRVWIGAKGKNPNSIPFSIQHRHGGHF